MSYLLDNAAPETGGRFGGLEACYDEATFRYLSALGLGQGWRCWELGAGGGLVARWMGLEVGGSGSVLATDLNLDWIDADMPPRSSSPPRCDLGRDSHLSLRSHPRSAGSGPPAQPRRGDRPPGRGPRARRLARARGVRRDPARLPEPTSSEHRTFNRVLDAFSELLVRRGVNTSTYPRTLPWRMQRAGLTQTGAEARLLFTTGDSPGASVMRANLLQTGNHAVDAGLITERDVVTFLRLLDDPAFTFTMPLLVSAWGRAPQLAT